MTYFLKLDLGIFQYVLLISDLVMIEKNISIINNFTCIDLTLKFMYQKIISIKFKKRSRANFRFFKNQKSEQPKFSQFFLHEEKSDLACNIGMLPYFHFIDIHMFVRVMIQISNAVCSIQILMIYNLFCIQ